MHRRTRERLSAKKLFDEVVFASLDWPWKTVRLEPDTLHDYCQRPATTQVSVAELYHENSKLFPERLTDLLVTRIESQEVRQQFLERRRAAYSGLPDVRCIRELRQVLSGAVRILPPELFYAIELRLVVEDRLLTHEPLSDQLHLLKRVSALEQQRLQTALRLLALPGEPERPAAVLLVVANFGRNDLLFGARGYRRTLVEAGRIAEGLLGTARDVGVAAQARTEFTDREIDAVIQADGIEEGVVIAVEFGSAHDVR